MKKSQIVSVFSLLLSTLFFFFWFLLKNIGIFMLWIPEHLYYTLGVKKELFVQSLNNLLHSSQYENVWQSTIGSTHDLYLYFAFFFALICIISFIISLKKDI